MPGMTHRRLIAAGATLGVLVLVLGMLLAPGAVRRGADLHGTSADVGDVVFSGLAGSVTAPVHLLWVRPVASAGLDARVEVCRGTPPHTGVGLLSPVPPEGEDGLRALCLQLDPAGFGTRVDAEAPSGEANESLVLRLVPTTDGRHTVCGVRVLYRSGLRIAFTSLAGPAVHIDVPRQPDGDLGDEELPREPC